MKGLKGISTWLLIISGLNWGLIGFFKYDLIASIFGGGDAAAAIPRVIYAIVGIAALIILWGQFSKD